MGSERPTMGPEKPTMGPTFKDVAPASCGKSWKGRKGSKYDKNKKRDKIEASELFKDSIPQKEQQ